MTQTTRSRAIPRVVVTGMGIISPVGSSITSAWENILAGKSGITPITDYDPSDLPVRFRGAVQGFDIDRYFDAKEARKMDGFIHYGFAAAADAIADQIPLAKLGRVEDIADAVVYLARAEYITGETLNINGGMYML